VKLPAIGFRCSPYRPDGSRIAVEPALRSALDLGYRLLDTAEMYGNERAVGRLRAAVSNAAVNGIGKAWRTNHRPEHLLAACAGSLAPGHDAFDLICSTPGRLASRGRSATPRSFRRVARGRAVGQPGPGESPLADTWAAMEPLRERGLAGDRSATSPPPISRGSAARRRPPCRSPTTPVRRPSTSNAPAARRASR
jgi:alcohol dehydrogenase (NADP+)